MQKPKWLLTSQPPQGGVSHTRNSFKCQSTTDVLTFLIAKKKRKSHQVTAGYFKSLIPLPTLTRLAPCGKTQVKMTLL